MGNGGAGHFQHGGDVDDALLLMAQQPEDAHAGGVAQLLEHVGNSGEMRGVHQLFVQAGSVCALPVVMGQRKIGHMASSFYPFWKFHSPFWKHGLQIACVF